ncbi:MAG: hypothetical protein CMJ46_03005 [Planctomyces sp.]|nr:hypothetical protein [Planctomyces sp.]
MAARERYPREVALPQLSILFNQQRVNPVTGLKTMKFAFAPESTPLDGYTIKRAIHRGGFGEVYYALSDAGKEVALKLLRQNTEIELRGVAQCLNLKHPNLVSIFDVKTDGDGDHWIIMEYVAGKTLDEVLAQYPHGMPLEKVSTWMEQICSGLSFLHDRGIVHRDMKPANLFIEDDLVKIGDIGLSKFITQSRRSAQTQSVGTVYYMAPEVGRGRYGHEVDIYALGIILYELITGRVPFDGESTGEILMKHLTDKPNLNLLPVAFRDVVARALEKDPQQRTASVTQFWNEFQAALRGKEEPINIPESSFAGTRTEPDHADGIGVEVRKGTKSRPDVAVDYAGTPRSHSAPVAGASPQLPGEKPIQTGGFQGMVEWYNEQNGMTQAVVIFAILFAIFASGLWPVALVLALLSPFIWVTMKFLGYVLIDEAPSKSMPRPTPPPVQTKQQPLNPVAHTVNHYTQKVKQKVRKWTDKEIIRLTPPDTVRRISEAQRLTELSNSFGLSAFYVAIFSSLYLFVSEQTLSNSLPTIFFLTATTLLAVWTIMGVSKVAEGRKLSGFWRRALLIPGALVVGSAAYGLSNYLMVYPNFNFSHDVLDTAFTNEINGMPLVSSGTPTLEGYLSFFIGMFFVRGWWGIADSYRSKKLRVVSILWSGALTLLQVIFFAFPLELALFWSVVSAAVIQLSTTWTPPRERRFLAEEQ